MTDTVRRLLRPASIAIVGASADLGKVNGRPLKHLLAKGYAGRILPVNPRYASIEGLPCFASVDALPEPPDLAVVAVPAAEVVASVAALGRRGAAAAVVFSSGFAETGEAGRALQRELRDTARAAGIRIVGPNCLGLVNGFENVWATFSQYADGPAASGPIGFVTQSGAFGTAIAALARQRGLGLGYFVNTGNECDLGFAELAMAVAEDERIRVVAGYLEGVHDGAALAALADRCRTLGKPLVLTKVGRGEAGARAAASHTGALAVPDAVFDAVLRQHGVLRARNEEQMLDWLEALAQPRRASGSGLGLATQSGGAGVLMADRAEELQLAVPLLAPDTQARIAAVMPAFGSATNPVDVTGQFVAQPTLLRDAVVAMMDDAQVHVGIVWLQLMAAHVDVLVPLFDEIRERTTKPVLVCWVAAPPEALQRLRALGLAVFGAAERAVDAAAALVRFSTAARRDADAGGAPAPAPRLPADAGDGLQPTLRATAWLQGAGVPMAPVALATTEADAVAEARRFGGPVALKIESSAIAHKTEVGGVVLGLAGEAAVRQGWRRLLAQVRQAAPAAPIDGVIVQPMADATVELVVGVQRDPVFGMVVMAGLGGVWVEVLKDVSFRRAPFDETEALAMLAELRGARLLDGVRGAPPIDRAPVARLLAALSRWAASNADRLAELDLNPVRLTADGPLAVDCVMVLGRTAESTSEETGT